jgi:hypothetical protein
MLTYFLNAEFNYENVVVDRTVAAVNEYVDGVVKDLEIKNPFDVIIYPNWRYTEETDGVDGYAMSGGVLLIRIDLRQSKFKLDDVLGILLKGVVYHEANHIARWQGPGYGTSLMEATISEGLATAYEKMIVAPYPLPHSDYSNINEMLAVYRTRNKAEDSNYNHSVWFFGVTPGFEKWLGYKVGTYLVEEALKKNPKISISELTRTKTEDILKLSGVEL